jgi:hypothetical protein
MLSGSFTHANRMSVIQYSWCTGEDKKYIPYVSQKKRIIKESIFRQRTDFIFSRH